MATVKPTPAKSQLAAVKKAEAQRAASQQAAQERAQRAAQMQRAAQLQQVAQRQAAQQAQQAAQLQQAAAQQAALERAQRAAQMQPQLQQIPQSPAQQAALASKNMEQVRALPEDQRARYAQQAQQAAQLQQIAQLQAAQERSQRAAQMTGGSSSIPRNIGLPQTIEGLGSFSGIPRDPTVLPAVFQQPGALQAAQMYAAQQQQIQGLGSFPVNLPPRDIGLGTPPPGFGGPRGLPSGAPPQQVEPFRPIEGMAGNLVGGFTPPPPPNQAGQLIGLGGQPPSQAGQLIGLGGQPQQRAQQAFDVTQGSSAYPPSFMPGQGVMNAGLGFGQAMGAPAVPQQSPTQAAFMQATQYNPRNQLNMSSNMQQPAQNQSTGFGQSNMFSNMQQSAPMQSNMNAGMGQNLSNAVGQTSANMFGGGPSASATQQPQQQPGPARTGGIF
jgi:chemotaxis protein histidine kinase CheA